MLTWRYSIYLQNRSFQKEIRFILEVMVCDPSIYTMDHPDFIVHSFMENLTGLKRVKGKVARPIDVYSCFNHVIS